MQVLLLIFLFPHSLIKMLYWMCEKSNCPPTGPQLEHAIKRNFGGYFDTFSIFSHHLPNLGSAPDFTNVKEDVSCTCILEKKNLLV